MTAGQVADLLRGWDNLLLLTHRRPDGDTLGSAVALCKLLRQNGKTVYLLDNPEATSLFTPYLDGVFAPADFVPERVVAVDIAAVGLLPQNALPYLEWGIDLCIDHHPSNEGYAAASWVEADKAACGELIFALVEELGELTAELALPLYVAVSTDTGCFQYSNTTPHTHRIAAALMTTGIDAFGVNKRHFRTKSFTRLKLEGMLAEGMELYDGGKIAVVAVTLEMMAALHAREEDAEDIAAFAGQVEGVEAAVTIRELKAGECKLSVRTNGGLNATRVCGLLGGGGHAAAAGCTVMGTPEEAKAAILDAIRQVRSGEDTHA